MPALPEAFQARMERLLGDDAEDLFQSLARGSDVGLRVNARKSSPAEFPQRVPWPLQPVPWSPTGFVVGETRERPSLHPLHLAGVFYLQDPAAMAVPEALDAQPGQWVADLAAAPGGKATRISEQVGPDGFLLANDVHPERTVALGRNLERWGADNTKLVRATVADLARVWGPVFDRVLLDAPCSGEGMFRKSPEARAMWSEATVLACALRQGELLPQAAEMVAPGGVLVYSTCTFAPEENEGVVAAFLRERSDFSVEPVSLPGVSRGEPGWAGTSSPRELAGAARLWPHRQAGEGHFLVKLRRAGGGASSVPTALLPDARAATARKARAAGDARPSAATSDVDAAARAHIGSFFESTFLRAPYDRRAWVRRRDEVYALPHAAPALEAGSTIRPGLWLGTLRKDRFEPSHALAAAVRPDDVQRRLDLPADAPDLARYLTGLELEAPGDDGWLLVCVQGFPLGWGRRVRGVVRNAYPKGLRLR